MANTAKEIYENLSKDYTNNFMPRAEIDISLSLGEIELVLQELQLHRDIATTWHWKFYLKQVALKSINTLVNKNTEDIVKETASDIKRIYEDHKTIGTNQTRAVLFEILIKYFPWSLSKHDLHEAFARTTIYDDSCAQLAFEKIEALREASAK